jgi:1-acyl-sn-glycerol-3-phosphate acyltransferase
MADGVALPIGGKMVERWRRFPREPDMVVYSFRSVISLIIRGLLRTYERFEIIGAENLPNDDESFVLVANHASHLDTLCLLAALPLGRLHQAFPVAAEDYFFRSLPRSWFATGRYERASVRASHGSSGKSLHLRAIVGAAR